MATEADKGDAKVTEEAPKHTAAEEAKEEATKEAAGEEEKKAPLTDDELLRKHYPRYFYDKKEKHFPVDLNRYTANKAAHPGINGVAAPSKDGKHTWLIYMSYFLWDGGVVALGGKGSHKHDLEIVIVEIKNHNQRVMRVFYAPHSSHEHMWIYHRDDVKEILDDGGRPRVFVSLGKHASYPISGKVTRLFGLGTDQCIRPQAKDRPLFILNDHTKRVEKIDGQFQGPRPRIHRDWSTAPGTRLNKVRKRRALPPAKQVRKQLEKTFAFWKK